MKLIQYNYFSKNINPFKQNNYITIKSTHILGLSRCLRPPKIKW